MNPDCCCTVGPQEEALGNLFAIDIIDRHAKARHALQSAAWSLFALGYGLLIYAGVTAYMNWLQRADVSEPGTGRVIAFLMIIPVTLILTCWLARSVAYVWTQLRRQPRALAMLPVDRGGRSAMRLRRAGRQITLPLQPVQRRRRSVLSTSAAAHASLRATGAPGAIAAGNGDFGRAVGRERSD